jgi:DinB superfamily
MNSIGWIVAHLAWQEQRYWLTRANSLTPHPDLNEIAAFGGPASTPSLPEMLGLWRTVTAAVDPWLDRLGADDLAAPLPGKPAKLVGDSLHRVNYHYWYHAGEIQAIRQMLGHRRLPQFVGSSLETRAAFRGE